MAEKNEPRLSSFGAYPPPAPEYAGMATQSVYIPMRDGARRAAEVVLPENLPPGGGDAHHHGRPKPRARILYRSSGGSQGLT